MADILLKTNLRKKLLSYFFSHPDESFYVRQIASLIQEDPGNLSRELKAMESEGLFGSRRMAGAKFYSLNTAYPLFKELKDIIFKTVGVEGSLRKMIANIKGIGTAFIYGSYARGGEKKDSDIDLIIVGSITGRQMLQYIRPLEKQLNREINVTVYDENEFKKECSKAGSFLNTVVRGKIILLKGRI